MNALQDRPLDPELQTKLANVMLILGQDQAGEEMLEQTARMAPGSAFVHLRAGQALLACGYRSAAAERFQRVLGLQPANFPRVIQMIRGVTGRMAKPLTNGQIVREVLPDSPALLFRFATELLPDEPDLRDELLKGALELLADATFSDHDQMVLRANVQLELGMNEAGMESLEQALDSDPNDKNTRYRLARLLLEAGDLQEAKAHAERLLESSRKIPAYNSLYKEISGQLDIQFREGRN